VIVDLSVALTWIAISAASVKGLSAFAHAATAESTDTEWMSLVGDDALAHEDPYSIAMPARLLGDRR
jgi:hypothetical protein